MRLDKFLCEVLGATRKEATRLLKRSEVTVDGEVIKSGSFKVSEANKVVWQERELDMPRPRYFMLNKPQGFVCSHEDGYNHTAFVLLDEPRKEQLHYAGRLDVDTTGLVLITDDGQWSHKITSPKHKCSKTYVVDLADPIEDSYRSDLEKGIQLKNERELTLPAQMEVINEHELKLTIHEGKYHQVKRMFAALGNKVDGLHRESVGEIILDPELPPGEYRELTAEEVLSVFKK
jgi:16S rRNA pseudouridine516 synthase